MRRIQAALFASLALLNPATAVAQDEPIVVERNVAQSEIERILNADNVDTTAMSPREVADAVAAIPRGRAPEDFWKAYRDHVDAWQHFAELVEAGSLEQTDALIAADRAVNDSFGEVERIARRHGARIPIPKAVLIPIV